TGACAVEVGVEACPVSGRPLAARRIGVVVDGTAGLLATEPVLTEIVADLDPVLVVRGHRVGEVLLGLSACRAGGSDRAALVPLRTDRRLEPRDQPPRHEHSDEQSLASHDGLLLSRESAKAELYASSRPALV